MPTQFAATIAPDWSDVKVPNLAGGLNLFDSPDGIKQNQLLEAKNVRIIGDRIVGDLGFYPYHEVPLTLNATYAAGTTVITTVTNCRYRLRIGSTVYISLDDGTVHPVTILSFSASNIFTISAALPSQASAGNAVAGETWFIGTPILSHRLQLADGSFSSLLFTTITAYLDSTTKWSGIPISAGSVLNTNKAFGDIVVRVTDGVTPGFAAGDPVSIVMDDGSLFHALISSIAVVSGNIRDFTLDYPLWGAATAGNVINRLRRYHGTIADRFVAVNIPWADSAAITNGIDPIDVYANSTAMITTIPNLPSAGNTKCKSLAVFNNALLLLNTTEGGVPKPQRVRWCDDADITNWSTLNAGFEDLYDTASFIETAKQLGPYLIIYKRKGIHRCEISVRDDRKFEFNQMISSHGIISPYGVIDIDDDNHMILDDDDLWVYTGDFGITPLGVNIKTRLFGVAGELDPQYYSQATLIRIPALNEILVVYRATGDSGPKKALRYSIPNKNLGALGSIYTAQTESQWTRREFPFSIFGLGVTANTNALAWIDLIGDWSAQAYPWNAAYSTGGGSQLLLIGGTVGSPDPGSGAWLYTQSNSTDNGRVIPYEIQSKEFEEVTKIRQDWLQAKFSGTVSAFVSLDSGASWILLDTQTVSGDPDSRYFYQQFIGKKYRYKFTSVTPGMVFESFSARVTPESEI